MIEEGLRAEKSATVNRDFASYEEALHYFVMVANITDSTAHFGNIAQGRLPLVEEEPNP
ncbi:MAG: hypothetical protein ABSG65_12485 [Bryobacteraceae bacterium]|jgi:hypothetical protein